MTRCTRLTATALVAIGCLTTALPSLQAQVPARPDCRAVRAEEHATMDHAAHLAQMAACDSARPAVVPALPGQAAFGLIGEVVRILKADPATDWTRVDLEALRQHLIDMDEVTMRAVVTQRQVAGGIVAEVTGPTTTAAAIKRMVTNHARMLGLSKAYETTVEELPDGVRLTVTAEDASDQQAVARLRGLGFVGLLTEGDHHAPHHLAIARGDRDPHGHH